jgi:hypothetical protein
MLISTKYPANRFLGTIVLIGIWLYYTFVFVSFFGIWYLLLFYSSTFFDCT